MTISAEVYFYVQALNTQEIPYILDAVSVKVTTYFLLQTCMSRMHNSEYSKLGHKNNKLLTISLGADNVVPVSMQSA